MITISKQDAQNRYKTLPAILKDAIFSVEGADAIGRIQEANHLSSEKTSMLAKLSGYVFLGFLHREDLAKEIQESLLINPEMAKTLAEEVNQKILNQYKEELDHIFAPNTNSSVRSSGFDVERKTETQRGPVNLGNFSAPSAPKAPVSLRIPSTPQAPSPVPHASSNAQHPTAQPFILRSETSAVPAPQKPGFRLDIPKPPSATTRQETKPIPAHLEIGQKQELPRTVHYSAMKTPIPASPRLEVRSSTLEVGRKIETPQPNPPQMAKGPVVKFSPGAPTPPPIRPRMTPEEELPPPHQEENHKSF